MDFLQFYRDQATLLWQFLYRLCRNEDDAKDVMQSAFERFLKEWEKGSFTPEQSRPVLYRLAYQAFVEHHRGMARESQKKQKAKTRINHPPEPIESISREIEVESFLSVFLDRERSPLSHRQQSLLRLRVSCGLRPQEIQEILSISRQSYYRDMERIRILMSKRMQEGK